MTSCRRMRRPDESNRQSRGNVTSRYHLTQSQIIPSTKPSSFPGKLSRRHIGGNRGKVPTPLISSTLRGSSHHRMLLEDILGALMRFKVAWKHTDRPSTFRMSIMIRSFFGAQEGDFSLSLESICVLRKTPQPDEFQVEASKLDKERQLEDGTFHSSQRADSQTLRERLGTTLRVCL